MMSAEMFPTSATYLAALPEGLASHPRCQVKGSLLRELVVMRPVVELRDSLPPILQRYFEEPPDVTSWVPEVHMQVLLHAVFDRSYAHNSGGEAAFLQWMRDSNRSLFKNPLYRILFFVISPENFFNRSDRRWSTFRRGSTLEKLLVEPGRARLRVHHPRALYSDLSTKVRAIAFRVAAECAGARNLVAGIENRTSSEFDMLITWQ